MSFGRGDIIDFESEDNRNEFIYDNLNGTPERFIKSIINKHYETLQYCDGIDYTDLIQEGWIALMLAAKRYDRDKEVKFSTFAYPRVRGRIIRTLGKEIKNNQAEGQYDQEVFADSVERVAHVSKEFDELSEQEREIFELYAKGYSTRGIASEMEDDISYRTVARRLNKIGFVTKRP